MECGVSQFRQGGFRGQLGQSLDEGQRLNEGPGAEISARQFLFQVWGSLKQCGNMWKSANQSRLGGNQCLTSSFSLNKPISNELKNAKSEVHTTSALPIVW